MNTAHLVYDGDCGFCTASATWLDERLRRLNPDAGAVAVVPWQSADLARLGLAAERCAREVVWVGPDGVHGGAQAFAAWLVHHGGLVSILGRTLRAPGVRWLADRVYAVVARHRHRLPGGTASCEMP